MPILDPEFLELTHDLDAPAFWAENDRCAAFTTAKPRCAASFSPDDHWLFEFLAVGSTVRYYHDKPYRDALHQEANRFTRQYVGRAFFDEDTFPSQPKRIENLFGAEFAYHEGGTPWFVPVTDDPAEFARVLDRAETIDLEIWALPDAFRRDWDQWKTAGKPLPKLGTGGRGPATIMTAVLGPETLFYWIYDRPELIRRFRNVLGRKMVELNRLLRAFSGNAEPGWWITDDNSALFNCAMYREFCYPVLEQVLEALAPGRARRYQHSDSDMAHLLDDQYALGIREVNYGPTIDAAMIRQKMPEAVIHGHLPPFRLRNGTPREIAERIVTDF
jgi:uroporphyrinogen decarboxylase